MEGLTKTTGNPFSVVASPAEIRTGDLLITGVQRHRHHVNLLGSNELSGLKNNDH
jgi:hypothetical protein